MKLLIVDDEFLIRDGIQNKINWSDFGIEVVGSAENGEAALDVLKKEAVDILVTDIRMPKMNGLELSREARKLYPNIKIILLSGFEEFEFAKQALELSVMKYLLKPFTRKELEEAILQAMDEVKSMQRVEHQLVITMDRLQRSLPLLRERYLNEWVSGQLSAEELHGKLQMVDIQPGDGSFAVIVTVLDEAEQISPLHASANHSDVLSLLLVEDIPQWIGSGQGHTFQSVKGAIVTILDGLRDAEEGYKTAEIIKDRARQALGLTVSVGLGRLKPGSEGVAESYREALEAVEYRFLVGKNSIIPCDLITFNGSSKWTGIPDDLAETIISAIRTGKRDEMRAGLSLLFNTLKTGQRLSISDIKICMTEFLAKVLTDLLQTGVRLKDIYAKDVKEYNPYSAIADYKTIDDLQQGLGLLFGDLSGYILDRRGGKKRQMIELALDYIHSHYQEEDLSIYAVSEKLYINPTYFSRLFKQEVGCTFTDYLTKTRLEGAKQWLKGSSHRVSEIAFMVGFKDPFYFSTLFKKQVGMNPTEFREQG